MDVDEIIAIDIIGMDVPLHIQNYLKINVIIAG